MENFLDYFKPLEYRLNLVINRTKESFYGVSSIYGLVPEPKPNQPELVKFHAVGMEIENVMYHPMSDAGYEGPHGTSDYKYNPMPCEFEYDGETITIPITSEMYAKIHDPEAKTAYYGDPEEYMPEVAFNIQFRAKLNRNMQGCYLSTYQHNGKEYRIATTQFESHYAREAFPCIDLPAAKANFSLNIEVPDLAPGETILSNMPLESRLPTRFFFQTTPKMSTYLIAWVIGPFQSVSTVNRHGVKVSSYGALNQPLESLIFANNTAARALDYYDEQFGVKYPLEKLDQVALPDFEAGAMENWGLVTYREAYLLAAPDASIDTKQSVAVTVTHELAHQWFGDLVTMRWWDDLWLNESFASVMECCATDALYPEFQIWQDFFTTDAVAAFRRDALPGVQSVQQDVKSPDEIATLFDSAIVYAKGARLVLMLMRLLGEEGFYRGIHDYFRHYRYGNTVADDLWKELQPYADFDVKAFMTAWITQPGYPVLTHKAQNDPVDPLAIQLGSSANWTERRFLITEDSDDTAWPLPEVSSDLSGYYLINLSDADFAEKLRVFDQLSMEQRLRVLIDRMLLAKTTQIPSSSLLELLPKFQKEQSASLWNVISSILNDLKLFCPPETPARTNYQRYLVQLIRPQLAQIDLTKTDDSPDTTRLRSAILSIACFAEDGPTLKQLVSLYRPDLSTIDPELRDVILFAKMHFDEAEVFNSWLQEYQRISAPDLKSELLYALCLAKEPAHLDHLLELLTQPAIVRPQDHLFLYAYLLRNYRTRLRALDWLLENWSYVENLSGDKTTEDYLRITAMWIQTEAEAQKFYAFFDQKVNDLILKRALKVAHAEIDARLRLIMADSAGVAEKLAKLAQENS